MVWLSVAEINIPATVKTAFRCSFWEDYQAKLYSSLVLCLIPVGHSPLDESSAGEPGNTAPEYSLLIS